MPRSSSTPGHHVMPTTRKPARCLENHAEWSVIILNEFSYPYLLVSAEVATALMVCYTWHQRTPVLGSVVRLQPLGGAPLVNNHFLALGIHGALARNHLHIIMYMTYKKFKLSLHKLR